MINFLVAILIASIFIFDWLFFVMGVGGRAMTWVPEIIAIFIALSIPFKTATSKNINLPLKYVFLFCVYLAHILIGFLLNDITGWTMLAGLRIYTKFIPIFLIPLIFPFSDRAFKNIVLWIFALSMLQLPVVVWQRFVQYATSLSGDPMGGTLGVSTSGILAIYLIVIISFLISFYFKEQISFPAFLASLIAAFIPITLNETKISFILLPISFLIPAVYIKGKTDVIIRLLTVFMLLLVTFVVFKGVYDYWAAKRWGYGIEGFISQPKIFKQYNKNRLDPMKNAVIHAMADSRFAFFGHGAGNVSEGFTKKLSGKYVKEGEFYNVSVTFAQLMWETGILGTFFFFLFPIFVFWDAVKLCKQDGWPGAFSLGMIGFATFFTLSMFYTFTINANVLIFIFFLAAGQLVSQYARTDEIRFDTRQADVL